MKQANRIVLALAFLVVAAVPAISAEPVVSRAQFTSAVLDREPTDELAAISPGADKVFFFTELRNMEGTTITHRWSLNGSVMAEVTFNVRASRWRVYSSKTLLPEWRGTWVVDVVDENGSVIASRTIGYGDTEPSETGVPESAGTGTSVMTGGSETETMGGGQPETTGDSQQ